MKTRKEVFDKVAQSYIGDPNSSYESHIDRLLDVLSGNETEFGEGFSWEKRREILKEEIDMFSTALAESVLINAGDEVRYPDSYWETKEKVESKTNIPI